MISFSTSVPAMQFGDDSQIDVAYWCLSPYSLSLAALDIRRGITTDNRAIAHQETMILKHGNKFIALCDSSKIGRFAYAQVSPVSVIDVLITDGNVDPDFVKLSTYVIQPLLLH